VNDDPEQADVPASAEQKGQLARRVMRGAAYLGVGQYALVAIGLVKTPILARLVAPEIYGVVALASSWVSFLGLLRMELPEIVISDPQHQQARLVTQYLFEVGTALLGALAALLLRLIAPQVAVTPVWQAIFALTAVRVFFALTSTPLYILRRDIRQETLTRLTLIGGVAGALVSIGAAALGYPLLSLLLDAALPVIVLGGGAWIAAGWRPTRTWDAQIARDIRAFAVTLWTSGLLGKITWEFDDWLLGNVTGSKALGYYSRAFYLANLPMNLFAGVIGGIALSMYAQSKTAGLEVLRRAYELTTWLLARIVGLSSVVMLAAAEEIMLILLGPKWVPVPPLLRLMFLYVLARPLFQNNAQLLLAARREKQFRVTLIVQAAILLLVGPVGVIGWGAEGASAAVSVMQIAGFALAQWYTSRHLGIRSLKLYLLPTILLIGLTPAAYALGTLAGGGVVASLIVKSVSGAAAFAAVVYLLERDRVKEVYALVMDNLLKRGGGPDAQAA
jgi:PST family polysaccharide transporter